ncbi:MULTISPECIES: 4-(cytidine 5'-diphospho)-2-C-methyl-D-erythritol kinase [unclassified Spirosoma]|uniref:4-(cytidine 5'-diphospho)-2-C-methyl-D-erythritol kinase n=1 Tax=unclassified Spirosoma TaxID=2621999 RepID=UPI000964FA34|nr:MULTISPECIES: 4-(cytidine 5'-diphospho)-2-C-methyl-D-erythritol kinase [unclassified Spirosoma]MBN8824142.1 4-(cytidine 5'-diphospho)-2-C-methyl-D-erythritol kinase [Spirosoma sp.]OJW78882.1 MAG: 4-(cytidine 5'-diphospho)-2-C-methyl-D-erythritol kinase [Spirosoma sp. 48-14]
MIAFPTCKINIGLRITEKRPDGYHNLQSCFYPVTWGDILETIPATDFRFSSSGLPIPGDGQTNLCVRAYNLLKADFDLPPVSMHLHKIVPIGAGLGGGSADAAFTLKLLNDQFALGLGIAQLEDYARTLGSDCAFFVQNRPLYCLEKGDVFSEISVDLTGYYILLVYPNLAISTAEAYAGVRPHQPELSLFEQLQAPIDNWRNTIHNDFEDSLFPRYPRLADIKQQLYEEGAVYASMSGSGSTVYGIFNAPITTPNQFQAYSVWLGKL